MYKKAIFPGSFDPFTQGHYDVVVRASVLFDEVVVAIGVNTNKNRYFTLDHMKAKITEAFAGNNKVKVDTFVGLTAEYARQQNAKYLVRGLRNTTDFEYENTIGQANKYINPELETVFFITAPTLAFISSTIVRDLHKYGADVGKFLPYAL